MQYITLLPGNGTTFDRIHRIIRVIPLWMYWFFKTPPATPEEQKFVHEEEFYVIHGTFWRDGRFQYNPINCGLFEANRQHKAGIPVENIVQRTFHKEYNTKYEKLSIQYIDKVTTDLKKYLLTKISSL